MRGFEGSGTSLVSHARAVVVAGLLAASTGPALANSPGIGADITSNIVYLGPNAWLRYNDSLLSRVYTTTKATLELKGRGVCRTFLCPVTHNSVELWARRTRLDLARPLESTVILRERTLRRGDNGDDVRAAQQALILAGYGLTADGKYGRGTERAVKEFQRKSGLTADGAVGPQTRLELQL